MAEIIQFPNVIDEDIPEEINQVLRAMFNTTHALISQAMSTAYEQSEEAGELVADGLVSVMLQHASLLGVQQNIESDSLHHALDIFIKHAYEETLQ